MGVLTRADVNRAVQPWKIGRRLKFQIKEVEGLYYLYRENKDSKPKTPISTHAYPQLTCAFVFAYAKSRFSHDAAQIKQPIPSTKRKRRPL